MEHFRSPRQREIIPAPFSGKPAIRPPLRAGMGVGRMISGIMGSLIGIAIHEAFSNRSRITVEEEKKLRTKVAVLQGKLDLNEAQAKALQRQMSEDGYQ